MEAIQRFFNFLARCFGCDVPADQLRLTPSTWFTLSRVFVTPFIVLSIAMHWWYAACILFTVAALTDTVDGSLARWRSESTVLGSCIDPIADKIFLLSTLFTLAIVQTPFFPIPLWFVFLVVAKEILLIIGWYVMHLKHGVVAVEPTVVGKSVTVLQIGFVVWLFLCHFFGWSPAKTYYAMLVLMTVMVLTALAQYIYLGTKKASKGN